MVKLSGATKTSRVYLDNCTTSPTDEEVVRAMLPYFGEIFGHPLSVYSLGQEANEAVERSAELIARTVNARPDEIVFTSGGTEANDLAVRGIAYANKSRGNHIITTKVENPSVLRICEGLERQGFRIDYLDVDEEGFIDLDQLRRSLTRRTVLVSVMHVNDEIGTIEPIEEVGEILQEQDHKVYFHTDAVASYARVRVDIDRMDVDLASISAHKIHGPKGVGALVVRKGTRISPTMSGYVSLNPLRPGTENVPGIVGFAKAAEMAFGDFEGHANRMARLRDRLVRGIEERIPYVIVHGPKDGRRSPAIACCSFRYIEGESIMLHLDLHGISVATGSACATRKLEPSHVLTAIGVDPEVAHGAIKFSLSWHNTEDDIDYVLDVLPGVVERLRRISPLRPGRP